MTTGTKWFVFLFIITAGVVRAADVEPPKNVSEGGIKFVLHKVGDVRSEACGVADFNKDGKLDIVAGEFVYFAPDWKSAKIRTIKGSVDDKGKGYRWDFANMPLDVDCDGLPDVVSADWFEKRIVWHRNTGAAGGEWPTTIIHEAGNFETAHMVDIDGDGKEQEVVSVTAPTFWYEVVKNADGKREFTKHVISEKGMAFGAGSGDVNGDGKPDIIRPNAWFEAPADIRKDTWKEHPLSLGGKDGKVEHTGQIFTMDVNGDGLNDIVTTSAHKYGIFWYEQQKDGTFKQHVIDDTWTQAHSPMLADIDGCGVPELVVGKRFYAHNGSDPEANAPIGVYYYKVKKGANPVWSKYVISYNEGVGAGLSIAVADMDGDGDLDLVVTGKWGGPAWFENKLK
ncbi:MAG: hypothetical protein A2283_23540 [Lentisphaerae bacterium RIFOXYA12_FULL_48_11]|nr:MAG: hypothetical protein A2283_23540 [Lentisphaerae bacterium RIFOXYA12_FULL_48_11]